MVRVLVGVILTVFSLMSSAQEEVPQLQVNSDITVSCYFTVRKLMDKGQQVYRVISSSPRDCGAVDKLTGRLIETDVNLFCPTDYLSVGFPRGGPIGSHQSEIYYQAQGMCRAVYYLPINDFSEAVIIK